MTENEIQRLLHAIRALMGAVERALMTDTTDGVGDAMVTNYTKLHTKIAESYPEDYYLTDVLALDVPEDTDNAQKIALVRLAATQLESYLQSLLEDQESEEFWGGSPPPGFKRRGRRGSSHWRKHRSQERDFGAELSDEILNFTKETLRRALSSIDIVIDDDVPEPPEPPKPKRKPPVEPDDDVI